MTLYLPTAGFGNSRVLATVGGAGELMAFFYPRLDFARNIREAMPAVYVHDGADSRLYWCFGDEWAKRQWFNSGSNVLHTELHHHALGFVLTLTDVIPPDVAGLVRNIRLNRISGGPDVTLLHYFQMEAGDAPDRNAVQFLPESHVVIQHFQDVVLGVASKSIARAACGLAPVNKLSDVKRGLEAGRFDGGTQCIGRVDFCLSIDASNDAIVEWTIGLAGARSMMEAVDGASSLVDTDFDTHFAAADSRAQAILERSSSCADDDFQDAYQRAVLVLHDLFDKQAGTWIAAPEFDPGYQYSGGYGYCWPRDAAVSAVTAARLGFANLAERFFQWAKNCQLSDGHWYQRYWLNGAPAASWCVFDDEIQLDQTCAMVHAAGAFARGLKESDRHEFVETYRTMASNAVDAIVRHLDESGLHKKASDLWECCHGTFAYTMGGVFAAIRDAREVFNREALPWEHDLKQTTIDTFWDNDRGGWLRRIDPDGNPDPTLDSSVLGLIEPWELLDLSNESDRELARATIEGVARGLAVETKHGTGIRRFQHEHYMGGGWGCVNTLWLAQCRLKLAESETNIQQQHEQIESARRLIHTAVAFANPTGQLPELVPNGTFAFWAAPHGWASSLLIDCVLRLNRLSNHDRGIRQRKATESISHHY
jgi:GH15 family glucan-1,4-alpha-glucosidase